MEFEEYLMIASGPIELPEGRKKSPNSNKNFLFLPGDQF
jgi:hypothetical protein